MSDAVPKRFISRAETIATCRLYGARYLRSRRISTGSYLAGRPRRCPRLVAERRHGLTLRLARRRGAAADRDLLKEYREDDGERGDARGDEEEVVQRRGERTADGDEHGRRDSLHDGGIEDRLRVAGGRNRPGELRRDGGEDLLGELVREHGAEDRNAHGASDVPPELDLAGDHAEVARVDRALSRVQIEGHADANAEPDEHEVAHDLDLGRTDRDLREQVETDHQKRGADRPEVPVATHADHELAGDEARDDETDHQRGDQETRVRRGDSENPLIDESDEEDRAEHREPEKEADRGGHRERRVLPEIERNNRVRVAPLDDEEDHAHHGRDEDQPDHLS